MLILFTTQISAADGAERNESRALFDDYSLGAKRFDIFLRC